MTQWVPTLRVCIQIRDQVAMTRPLDADCEDGSQVSRLLIHPSSCFLAASRSDKHTIVHVQLLCLGFMHMHATFYVLWWQAVHLTRHAEHCWYDTAAPAIACAGMHGKSTVSENSNIIQGCILPVQLSRSSSGCKFKRLCPSQPRTH
jgi:hypothetical protein